MSFFVQGVFPVGIKAVQTTKCWMGHTAFDAALIQDQADVKPTFIEHFNVQGELHWLKQTHSDRVEQAPFIQPLPDADGSFTTEKKAVCVVKTADCLPVLIANQQATWVAAVHCGWRGLYGRILSNTVSAYRGEPEDLVVWLGPCIQRSAYQVDTGFVRQFLSAQPDTEAAFDEIKNGHSYADLPLIASIQLNALGVKKIHDSQICTHQRAGDYHSWRRDESSKRMASMIWLD